MVPRKVAQNCVDTARERSRNRGKSWATEDAIHLPKVCAAFVIHRGNVDMASPCVMHYLDTSSACSGAR